jgi:hypothetical protein
MKAGKWNISYRTQPITNLQTSAVHSWISETLLTVLVLLFFNTVLQPTDADLSVSLFVSLWTHPLLLLQCICSYPLSFLQTSLVEKHNKIECKIISFVTIILQILSSFCLSLSTAAIQLLIVCVCVFVCL